jgi:hypothetical protein
MPHVRICAGGGRKRSSLPRQFDAAGGAGSRGTPRARNGHSTALFTHGCQSFLDHVIDMEILGSVQGGVAPHYRSPTSAIEPAGQDLGAPLAPGIDDSAAPIAADCQLGRAMPLRPASSPLPAAAAFGRACRATIKVRGQRQSG